MELTFNAPFVTSRGLVKSGVLLPKADVAGVHLVARSEAGLTPEESAHRDADPLDLPANAPAAVAGVGRNLVNTLRDAFAKAFSAILSAVTRNPQAAAIADQKAGVESIGTQLIGAAGNAYDPMLKAPTSAGRWWSRCCARGCRSPTSRCGWTCPATSSTTPRRGSRCSTSTTRRWNRWICTSAPARRPTDRVR